MKQLVMTLWFLALLVLAAHAQAPEAALTAAIETYDSVFKNKDVETIKTLLAPEILLYEHSVRNDGLQDVFENHLKPEILQFEDLQLDFSDVRITPGLDVAPADPPVPDSGQAARQGDQWHGKRNHGVEEDCNWMEGPPHSLFSSLSTTVPTFELDDGYSALAIGGDK